jgi:hypothetical protein
MKSFTLTGRSPIRPFGCSAMCEARIPVQGNRNRASINQINSKSVIGHGDLQRLWVVLFN